MIQIDHPVGLLCPEVCRWVIECDVPVLTYSDHADINLVFAKLFGELLYVLLDIALSYDKMRCLWMDHVDEPLLEILAEGGDVSLRKIDILIKMEHLDL